MDTSKMPALHEIFAMEQVLSRWPDDISFSEVKKLIIAGSRKVSVAEMFEDWPDEMVIIHMDELADATAKLVRLVTAKP
jgi:hypothetical protein